MHRRRRCGWALSITTVMDTKEAHLICMRPRCDCVRLDKETTFNFLPLVAPSKFRELQGN